LLSWGEAKSQDRSKKNDEGNEKEWKIPEMPRPTKLFEDDKQKPRGEESENGNRDFPRKKKFTEEKLGRTELLQHGGC
jgi:hypothetical protein